jgi:ribonuclease HII
MAISVALHSFMKPINLPFDATLRANGYRFIVGTDEAGRGPIAGPVVAASVIIDERIEHPYIYDSKQMTEAQRERAYSWIMDHAVAYSIAVIDVATIDRINILEASRLGMMQAIDALNHAYDVIVTDAMRLPSRYGHHISLIKGDAQSFSIACASILAKVTRDRIMYELDQAWPHYGFAKHKGYPTSLHVQQLRTLGVLKGVHRVTFSPVRQLLSEVVSLLPK